MFRFLIRLRNKSNNEKKIFLVVSTIVVIFLLMVVWFFLSNIFSQPEINVEDSEDTIVVFRSVGEQITYSVENLQKIFKEARKNIGF